jgi:hypothetical protein
MLAFLQNNLPPQFSPMLNISQNNFALQSERSAFELRFWSGFMLYKKNNCLETVIEMHLRTVLSETLTNLGLVFLLCRLQEVAA